MTSRLHWVQVTPRSIDAFEPLVGAAMVAQARQLAAALAAQLAGCAVWNINSTARGGGVAEMLETIIGYARGAGVDARWLVIDGDPEFFRVTKRLHNALHGVTGDGSALSDAARAIYDRTTAANAAELTSFIAPGDVAIVHDPQPAGLIASLADAGVRTVWRCHVGHDARDPEVDAAWAFLLPYVDRADAFVFSRPAYVPEGLAGRNVRTISPTIDPFSAKNQHLDRDVVAAILVHAGLLEGHDGGGSRGFCRADGSPGRVDHSADVMRLGRAPDPALPLVVQVSRWDRLKDHVGVLRGFSKMLESRPAAANLVLAGPNVHAVADDPEGAEVFGEIVEAWRALPHDHRRHVHLANLPMVDVEENAAIVNALQRRAAVVVQKSLHEGFGLTVAEAMWKGRAVVASRVGGIQDQIEHGVSGLLLDDPTDVDAFAATLGRVLDDEALRARLGEQARERVRHTFLGLHSLLQYGALIEPLLSER